MITKDDIEWGERFLRIRFGRINRCYKIFMAMAEQLDGQVSGKTENKPEGIQSTIKRGRKPKEK